jgi:hypothetical protein
VGGCALSETEVHLGVPLPERVGFPGCLQPSGRIRTDRLEHPIADATRGIDRQEQALLAQRDDVVEDVSASDLTRLLEVEPADKDRQLGQQVLRGRRQQVIAPVDGVLERSMALRQIAIPTPGQGPMESEPISAPYASVAVSPTRPSATYREGRIEGPTLSRISA